MTNKQDIAAQIDGKSTEELDAMAGDKSLPKDVRAAAFEQENENITGETTEEYFGETAEEAIDEIDQMRG